MLLPPMSLHSASQRREKGHALSVFAVLRFDSFLSAFQRTDAPVQTGNPEVDICRENRDSTGATSDNQLGRARGQHVLLKSRQTWPRHLVE